VRRCARHLFCKEGSILDTKRRRKIVYLVTALLGGLAASVWFIDVVAHAKGSTAAVLFLLVPFVFGAAALAAVAALFVGYALADVRAKRIGWTHPRVFWEGALSLRPSPWS
jgi:hypothetical protein